MSGLGFTEAAGLGTCFAPKGEVAVHDGIEGGAVVGHEQMGELVVTTLAAEAMPLIRYRTGQAVSFETAPCSCGRTLLRVKTPFSFF